MELLIHAMIIQAGSSHAKILAINMYDWKEWAGVGDIKGINKSMG